MSNKSDTYIDILIEQKIDFYLQYYKIDIDEYESMNLLNVRTTKIYTIRKLNSIREILDLLNIEELISNSEYIKLKEKIEKYVEIICEDD